MREIVVQVLPNGYFALKGDLNRTTVPKCWLDSLSALKLSQAEGHSSVIDMADVEHVDTAGLAWLINTMRECRLQEIELTLKNVPETLLNLAKISNVDSFLPIQ